MVYIFGSYKTAYFYCVHTDFCALGILSDTFNEALGMVFIKHYTLVQHMLADISCTNNDRRAFKAMIS